MRKRVKREERTRRGRGERRRFFDDDYRGVMMRSIITMETSQILID